LEPDTLTLGQKVTVTGTGTVSEAVTGGTFAIDMKAGMFLKEHWTGDICQAKTFTLPLDAGSVTWDGMKCPVAVGAAIVGTDILMSAHLPSSLASATISIMATATNGDKLLCMKLQTAPAGVSIVV